MKTNDVMDTASKFLGEGYTEPTPAKPGKMQVIKNIHIFLED
jgi:hypothetical protein